MSLANCPDRLCSLLSWTHCLRGSLQTEVYIFSCHLNCACHLNACTLPCIFIVDTRFQRCIRWKRPKSQLNYCFCYILATFICYTSRVLHSEFGKAFSFNSNVYLDSRQKKTTLSISLFIYLFFYRYLFVYLFIFFGKLLAGQYCWIYWKS